jgi:long-subunit acyl-CoA synthetase (AMP-forming)
MIAGGSRFFSNLISLSEDIKTIRPTNLGCTPIYWNSLYQNFLSKVFKRFNEEKKNIFDEEKQKNLKSFIEAEISQEIKISLGNRLFIASSGIFKILEF